VLGCAADRGFRGGPPAISKDALNRLGAEVRSWRLHLRTGDTFAELARTINPIVRGWMQFYGAFYRSAMYQLLSRINAYLVRWIRKKYKRLQARKRPWCAGRGSPEGTPACSRTGHGLPRSRASGDQGDKSRISREAYVRNLWEPGAAMPPATRPNMATC
jgi:hypothetical protein